MAANKKTTTPQATPVKESFLPQAKSINGVRPIDALLNQYATSHKNVTNKLINWVCTPLILFGILGLTWAIPFPYVKFLGQYNGFINWASFFIAICIYYYLRLSPVLSYLVLLALFGLSYGVMQLDAWAKKDGPALWIVSLGILTLALVGQFIGSKFEKQKISFSDNIKFLLISPAYLLHFILKKLSVKY